MEHHVQISSALVILIVHLTPIIWADPIPSSGNIVPVKDSDSLNMVATPTPGASIILPILSASTTRAERSGGKGKWNNRQNNRRRAPTPVVVSTPVVTSNELTDSDKEMILHSSEMQLDQGENGEDYLHEALGQGEEEQIVGVDRQGRPKTSTTGANAVMSLAERLAASGIHVDGGTANFGGGHDLTAGTRGVSGSAYPPPGGSYPGPISNPGFGAGIGGIGGAGGWVQPTMGWGQTPPQVPQMSGWAGGGQPNAKVVCYYCTINA